MLPQTTYSSPLQHCLYGWGVTAAQRPLQLGQPHPTGQAAQPGQSKLFISTTAVRNRRRKQCQQHQHSQRNEVAVTAWHLLTMHVTLPHCLTDLHILPVTLSVTLPVTHTASNLGLVINQQAVNFHTTSLDHVWFWWQHTNMSNVHLCLRCRRHCSWCHCAAVQPVSTPGTHSQTKRR